jgi:uncharacterized membrane protein YtjA (UPF0391 family)
MNPAGIEGNRHAACSVRIDARRMTPPFNPYVRLPMLRWALIFFVVAIVAAIFGFGGVAGEAAWIGKILLVVFVVLAIISLLMGRRTTVP